MVSVDFSDFSSTNSDDTTPKTIRKQIIRFDNASQFLSDPRVESLLGDIGIPKSSKELKKGSWTLCVLEGLKPRARPMQMGRLRWVLSSMMPLRMDFQLFLNNNKIISAKEKLRRVIELKTRDFSEFRIDSLTGSSDWKWRKESENIVCDVLPSGIRFDAFITEESLSFGKSEDIRRSNGFFVRVRGRVVNETDALFGLHALSHATFNRFRADVEADDLHAVIRASREGVEESDQTEAVRMFLNELFSEARSKYDEYLKKSDEEAKRKKEHEREYVNSNLVERPVADAYSRYSGTLEGSDALGVPFYLKNTTLSRAWESIGDLYEGKRQPYHYEYTASGDTARIVKFDVEARRFEINEDHEFVKAWADTPRAKLLLEDIITAEALLEVYLYEAGIDPELIGEILERRDMLLRSLARDKYYSLDAIASFLRLSADDESDLEVALIASTRALGFVASHLSGSGEPDGLAKLVKYGDETVVLTIEAKSSAKVPSLSAIDFSGLEEHKQKYSADGCLLVAPSYPGTTKDDSAAATRAVQSKISCWTVEDLARLVYHSESRQITADHVAKIATTSFKPQDVRSAVEKLLSEPSIDSCSLYRAILDALISTQSRLEKSPRTVSGVTVLVTGDPEFANLEDEDIRKGIADLAHSSKGAMRLLEDRILVFTSLEEVERRVSDLTGRPGTPRRNGAFRSGI